MSEFLSVKTEIRDPDCLVAALADLGFATVERGEKLALYGYQGDLRPQTADIVLRRMHIGAQSNDVGFARQADGTYTAIVSEFDTRNPHALGFKWDVRRDHLMQRYALHKTVKEMTAKGFRVAAQEDDHGVVRLVFQRPERAATRALAGRAFR